MSIYLDAAATSPVRREVLEAIWPYLTESFANASSTHDRGQRARAALTWARERLALAFHTDPEGVIFTSGGTESDNLAIQGMEHRGGHMIRSAIEHAAVAATMDTLAARHVIEQSIIGVDSVGRVPPDDLAEAMRSDTTLVSVMAANNEIGTVEPISDIGRICRDAGVALHVDGVQAAGVLAIDMESLGISTLSIAGHKLGAPHGAGALLRSSHTKLEPIMFGGGQQDGLRPGTENVAAAVALATAVDLVVNERRQTIELALATARLIASLRAQVPDLLITGPDAAGDVERLERGEWPRRLPGNVSFCVPGVHGESLLLGLQHRGFEVSSGSACAAGHSDPSAVLLAIGLDPETALSAVRCTFGYDQISALEGFVRALVGAIEDLRQFGSGL